MKAAGTIFVAILMLSAIGAAAWLGVAAPAKPLATETSVQKSPTVPPDGPIPNAFVEPNEVDLGDILVGSPPRVGSFIVSNRGSSPLNLVDWRASCSCASVSWDRATLAPGATTAVQATVKGFKDVDGATSSVVHLVCDDPSRPVLSVRLRWTLVRPVAFDPPELTLQTDGNGNLVGEANLCVAGAESPTGAPHFSASQSAVETHWAAATAPPKGSLGFGKRVLGKLTLKGLASKFEDEGYGLVNVSFSGQSPAAALQIRWTAGGGLKLEPRRFALTNLAPGSEYKVVGAGPSDFAGVQLVAVEPSDPDVRWRWIQRDGRPAAFEIVGKAPMQKGVFTRKLRLRMKELTGTVEILGFVPASQE